MSTALCSSMLEKKICFRGLLDIINFQTESGAKCQYLQQKIVMQYVVSAIAVVEIEQLDYYFY